MVVLRHESDVDTWGGPDRDYYTFVVTSVLLGLIGGDHIYLRSFKTALYKALFNLFTLGGWYWWDLSQILFQRETVLTEGLASPFDWIRNIGRGVFVNPGSPVLYFADKSYMVFGLLSVFLGLVAADKFYLGQYGMGIAKLILCLNIFTFFIGWLWAGWDAWNAVFCEKEVMEKGVPPPLGLGSVLPATDPSIFKLQKRKEGDEKVLESLGLPISIPPGPAVPWVHWTLGILGLLPKAPPACAPSTYVPPVEKPFEKPTETTKESSAPVERTQTGGAYKDEAQVPSAPSVPSVPSSPSGGPGPVIAGCLVAVVAAAGLKRTYEFISNQYQ